MMTMPLCSFCWRSSTSPRHNVNIVVIFGIACDENHSRQIHYGQDERVEWESKVVYRDTDRIVHNVRRFGGGFRRSTMATLHYNIVPWSWVFAAIISLVRVLRQCVGESWSWAVRYLPNMKIEKLPHRCGQKKIKINRTNQSFSWCKRVEYWALYMTWSGIYRSVVMQLFELTYFIYI